MPQTWPYPLLGVHIRVLKEAVCSWFLPCVALKICCWSGALLRPALHCRFATGDVAADRAAQQGFFKKDMIRHCFISSEERSG